MRHETHHETPAALSPRSPSGGTSRSYGDGGGFSPPLSGIADPDPPHSGALAHDSGTARPRRAAGLSGAGVYPLRPLHGCLCLELAPLIGVMLLSHWIAMKPVMAPRPSLVRLIPAEAASPYHLAGYGAHPNAPHARQPTRSSTIRSIPALPRPLARINRLHPNSSCGCSRGRPGFR